MSTIRVKTNGGKWKVLHCTASEQTNNSAMIHVHELNQDWFISNAGFIMNIGGNSPWAYELHPDDCAMLCQVEPVAQKWMAKLKEGLEPEEKRS